MGGGSFWVAILIEPPGIAGKLGGRHEFTLREVSDAVRCVKGLSVSPKPGNPRRFLIRTTIRGIDALVVVDELAPDEYLLVTAYGPS